MKFIFVLATALTFTTTVLAQHAHGIQKGPNGGQMEDVAGVHAELLASTNKITVNIFDESGNPVNTSGYTGSVLVVNGSTRETIKLEPSANNTLKGESNNSIVSGATITILIKTNAGKSGQARFKG